MKLVWSPATQLNSNLQNPIMVNLAGADAPVFGFVWMEQHREGPPRNHSTDDDVTTLSCSVALTRSDTEAYYLLRRSKSEYFAQRKILQRNLSEKKKKQ